MRGMRAGAISLAVVGLLAGAQLVPVDRTNPPALGEIQVPESVGLVLRRSCYDCHSHETAWPWYAYVAPISWLVSHDVHHGREHLNFSTWSEYDEGERAHKLEEIAEELEEGEMPPWFYTLRPDARLEGPDREALLTWARAAR